jgi:hypothetical protein
MGILDLGRVGVKSESPAGLHNESSSPQGERHYQSRWESTGEGILIHKKL